jgi:hypothetical protein
MYQQQNIYAYATYYDPVEALIALFVCLFA